MAAVRKIALFPIIFTSVGLVLVIIGFAISSHQNGSPIHVYLSVCVSGILIILLACAHSVLWYPVSAVLGAVIAFFNAFFLTGLGRILYSNGNSIREGFLMNASDSTSVDPDSLSYKLEFTGAMVAAYFWTEVMIIWQFYDTELLRGARHAMLRGIARKLTLPFIAVTGIGWLLVVVGFGIASAKGKPSASEPSAYPYWTVCISGPFTIVVAIIHAILSREPLSAILGIITTCLNVVFLMGLGMVGWSTNHHEEFLQDNSKLPKLEFVGAAFAAVFWTPVMILWHFFDYEVKRQEQYLALY